MRGLMISSILATDMGVHFDYMKKLGTLKEKLEADRNMDNWNGRHLEETKVLACALLIKCADISNVVSNRQMEEERLKFKTKYNFSFIELC